MLFRSLTEGDLINILNQMVPAQWRRSMISINFQPFYCIINQPYLKYVSLPEGDLINILNQMVPAQWRRSMISINFQPFNKSMTEVIEYMEKLEVLEATNKQSGTKENDKDKSEDKTGKSKNKTKKFHKKHSKSKGKNKKRNDSDYDWYDEYCAICKATGGQFWTNNTEDCRTLAAFKKKKQRATHGMTKKEFHALVNTQWKRFIEGKNKDSRPKKAKDSNDPEFFLLIENLK